MQVLEATREYYVFLSTGDPINELSAKYDREKRPLWVQIGSHKEEGFGRSPPRSKTVLRTQCWEGGGPRKGGFLAEKRVVSGIESGGF